NRVGLLYKQILHLLEKKLDDTDFMPHSKPFQAQGSHWFAEFDSSIPLNEQVIVSPVTNKAEAHDALCKIAVQGEGMTACSMATVANSHFDRFLKIYRERDAEGTEEPVLPITPNPNTLGEPVTDPELEKGRIKNKTARQWAQLFNLRYRMLLAYLSHYFYLAGDVEADGNPTPRGFLRNRALFAEMPNLSTITAELIKMSQNDDGGSNAPFAGPPFEIDYTLAVPDLEIDRWRLHRDLITAAGLLEDKILSETGDISEIIANLKMGDAEALEFINRQIA
ncbi:MAG TPA: ferritin-like domain-containing protein, partial [Pyrinomonadaceae bacterium]|nr:ferritin-like domain-containing protein [Pyrinomonadaceae bacterium]